MIGVIIYDNNNVYISNNIDVINSTINDIMENANVREITESEVYDILKNNLTLIHYLEYETHYLHEG